MDEGLTVFNYPRSWWKRIRTINGLERLNREIRRRTRVVGIFPHEASALRLISAVLAEIHEEWLTGRQYLNWPAGKNKWSNPSLQALKEITEKQLLNRFFSYGNRCCATAVCHPASLRRVSAWAAFILSWMGRVEEQRRGILAKSGLMKAPGMRL